MSFGPELLPWRSLVDVFPFLSHSAHQASACPFLTLLAATLPWPRRGHMQILAELLEIASHGGTTKTALVYKANLNFTLVARYLDYLEERGLIRRANGGSTTRYEVTAKGVEALSLYKRTVEVMDERMVPA